jgi:hypothetical protein
VLVDPTLKIEWAQLTGCHGYLFSWFLGGRVVRFRSSSALAARSAYANFRFGALVYLIMLVILSTIGFGVA